MQAAQFLITLALSVSMALAVPAAPPSPTQTGVPVPVTHSVTVYEHENYQGTTMTFNNFATNYDICNSFPLTWGISSITFNNFAGKCHFFKGTDCVEETYGGIFYECNEMGCRDGYMTVTGDTPLLGEWNDKLGSFKCSA